MFVVLFELPQNAKNIDVIVKIGIVGFDVFGEGIDKTQEAGQRPFSRAIRLLRMAS